ncbi:hypothetical protein [Sphaerisporangium dianthi]|uniref:Secreted protein n=1 Tax=Sphaerisporangium dianthi TaxID=1436120 RepID=A0ABV9CCJ1_9ACTN
MITKRLRVALSAGVLGVALAATLTASANADNASGDEPTAPPRVSRVCGHTMMVVHKDGKVYVDDGTGPKELKPGEAAPAFPALPPTGAVPEGATPVPVPPQGEGVPPAAGAPEPGEKGEKAESLRVEDGTGESGATPDGDKKDAVTLSCALPALDPDGPKHRRTLGTQQEDGQGPETRRTPEEEQAE